MKQSFSRSCLVLFAAGVLALPVLGQEKTAKDVPRFSSFISLTTDPHYQKKLAVLDEYIKAGDWKEAIRPLQSLLDNEEDLFVPVWVQGVGGKKSVRWASGWDEANRLLA